ncbi:hypothetical protein HDE_09105 [Halotydeus destructor]|nr:hypothetical protein HDE_09105 [Halotydeus destructor]
MCASKAIRLIVLAVVVNCSLAQNGGVFDSMMMGFSDAFGGSSGATSGSSVQMPITNGVNKKQTSFNPLGFGLNSLGRSKASNGVSGLMGSMGLADIAGNMETLQDMGSLTDNVASLSRDMTKVSLELEQSPQTIDMLLGSVDTSFDWDRLRPQQPQAPGSATWCPLDAQGHGGPGGH